MLFADDMVLLADIIAWPTVMYYVGVHRNAVSVHFDFGRSVATTNKVYSRFWNGWPK